MSFLADLAARRPLLNSIPAAGISDIGGLFHCRFFPTIPCIAALQLGWLNLPDRCHVCCGASIIRSERLLELRTWSDGPWLRRRIAACLHWCPSHAAEPTRFAFSVYAREQMRFSRVEAFGTCREFLATLWALNTRHDMSPPWIVFPGKDPYFGWGQGTAEYWRHFAWDPYWQRLSEDQRQRYLDDWSPPEEWRQFLSGSEPLCDAE